MELHTNPDGNLTGIELTKFEQDILGFFAYSELPRPATMAPQIFYWAESSIDRRQKWLDRTPETFRTRDAHDHYRKAVSALQLICDGLSEFVKPDNTTTDRMGYHGENC